MASNSKVQIEVGREYGENKITVYYKYSLGRR